MHVCAAIEISRLLLSVSHIFHLDNLLISIRVLTTKGKANSGGVRDKEFSNICNSVVKVKGNSQEMLNHLYVFLALSLRRWGGGGGR